MKLLIPEVDKIISELRAEATKRPQNMSKEEEIAYILKKADEKLRSYRNS